MLGGLVGVLDQVEFRTLAAAGLAFATVVLLGKRTIRYLTRLKMGDSGETDAEALRAHAASKANVPTMGGVLICGAIFVATVLLADLGQFYVQLGLLVLVWLTVLGGADDYLKLTASRRGQGRQGLYAWEKLVFQLGIGLLVGFFLYRHGIDVVPGIDPATGSEISVLNHRTDQHVLNIPGQRTYVPGEPSLADGLLFLGRWAFIMVAVLMVAGMSNAVNITDGMDGLAAGTSGIVAIAIALLALIAGNERIAVPLLVPSIPVSDELAVMAGAMGGACLGFLWWNCAPAQVFMGDTGSLALGGLMAYIALVIRQEFIVLLMGAVFLIEIASVVIQVGWFKYTRITTGTGRRVFRVAPYHHHLHLGGWTENQVVVRMWIVTVLLAIVGLATLKLR